MTSVCPWKGTASYYDVTVNGRVNRDAAWYYPHPSPAAAEIKDHVAFWHGVTVIRAGAGKDAGGAKAGGAKAGGAKAGGGLATRLQRMFAD
jgi:hypothetical protein